MAFSDLVDLVGPRKHSNSPRTLMRLAAAASMIATGCVLAASPAAAAPCQFIGGVQFGNIEPPLAVDATCSDPDYNENTFVTDSTEQLTFAVPGGPTISYTEVRGHFNARNTLATLPPGVLFSATLNRHEVVWRFPAKEFWQNRSMQQTYPLPFAFLNEVDRRFAFTNGYFTVSVIGGNPNVGYRVNAAATKLAKAYANQLYGNTGPIHSYLYGLSGGSVQALGAAEGPTGVWAGVVPIVIATDGLNVHSFQWQAHYAVAVSAEKRAAVTAAAAVGSGRSIYEGLNDEERSVLDELLSAGHPRLNLTGVSLTIPTGTGEIRRLDPTYEDDFWSMPGYAGANPPNYLTAAKVDGFATITQIVRNAQGAPTAIQFDPATVPALGSIGAANLQYYVYAADGTRTIDPNSANPATGPIFTLAGTLNPTEGRLTLTGVNSAVLLNALTVGGKIRINNLFFLAAIYYPRHTILDNGNPAYNQYKNSDGTPKYPQRAVQTAYLSNLRSSGGIKQTGDLKTKTMIMHNLLDTAAFPYAGGFYTQQVEQTLGPAIANGMYRLYYQENAGHTNGGLVAGIFNQMLLDLAAWAEQDVKPKPSSRFTIDPKTQIVQPLNAGARKGLQPVIHLTGNGGDRAEVGVKEPVKLHAKIQMPPDTGQIIEFSWSIERQGVPTINEPATVLATPNDLVEVKHQMSFTEPGEYLVRLNTTGDRNGIAGTFTPVQNLDSVRVVVR